jgi:hypothetical protein
MWAGEVDYNCAEQDDDLWLEERLEKSCDPPQKLQSGNGAEFA